jgi:tRNA threonylcarbamoyladenosine biosynthesis protein TsaE
VPEPKLSLPLADAQATEGLGAAVARSMPSLDLRPLVMHLHGELGAGKTTFVRGFLRQLGVGGIVRSPTYTLVEPYRAGALTCVHADLYRLRDPGEMEEIGLRDYLTPGAVLLIEWPEMGGPAVPPADLDIAIEYAGEGRLATLRPKTALGAAFANLDQNLAEVDKSLI